MPRKILMEHLADVVNEIQEAHREANPGRKIKLIEIAYWSDASQSKISRFESGESQLPVAAGARLSGSSSCLPFRTVRLLKRPHGLFSPFSTPRWEYACQSYINLC